MSTGHRVGLRTAVDVVARCCRVRVPEPVRAADLTSREEVRRMLATRSNELLVRYRQATGSLDECPLRRAIDRKFDTPHNDIQNPDTDRDEDQ